MQTRNRTKPSFKNKCAFYHCIDTLPQGAKWICKPFEITGDKRDENGELRCEVLHLWKQNLVECIRELISNPAFREKMQYIRTYLRKFTKIVMGMSASLMRCRRGTGGGIYKLVFHI